MIESFIKNYEYYKNVSLKKYNTYKLDVMCDYLVYPNNEEELIEILRYLNKNSIKYLILGGGSNIILSRPCFEVVIKLDKLNSVSINGNVVTAGAGVSLISLANTCMKNGLNGLSFAGGIPGSVGASVSMNAGAYNEDMAGIVKEVRVITPDMEVVTMKNSELDYSYRDSFLKRNKGYICISATMEFSYEDSDKIKEVMDNRRQRRVDSQPLDMPSAGSVFRNPEGVSTGKLIDDLGLKGYSIGGAMISTKHANFIVNTGTATYDDIIMLIEYIKDEVREKYNIELLLEQEIIR